MFFLCLWLYHNENLFELFFAHFGFLFLASYGLSYFHVLNLNIGLSFHHSFSWFLFLCENGVGFRVLSNKIGQGHCWNHLNEKCTCSLWIWGGGNNSNGPYFLWQVKFQKNKSFLINCVLFEFFLKKITFVSFGFFHFGLCLLCV